MHSNVKRALVAVTLVAAFAATFGWSTTAAHARVVAANTKFCAVFSGQTTGIDFEGLGPAEAKLGAQLFRKAARTGVPSRLKQDLKKVAKVYDRIAHGEAATDVLDAAGQAAVLPSIVRFSKYFAANCVPTTPST